MSNHRRPHDRQTPRSGVGRRRPRTITAVPGGTLPRWVRDEITRSTPKDRRAAAIRLLADAAEEFADRRFRQAVHHLQDAKALAPRSATIRELLGLSSYNLDRWDQALRELRAFRRLSGETIHMPVEIDCLRALGKTREVHTTWALFLELGGDRDTDREARVVYASHLLDEGRPADAWKVIKPGRLVSPAPDKELRRWFVAARVALAAGDRPTARQLVEAIARQQPDLAGLEELRESIKG
jgi:hypothetical protein